MNSQLKEICSTIAYNGGTAYLVGGCVRDKILGKEPKDFDIVVTGMTRADLGDSFPDHDFVGKSFPVIKLTNDIEVALARVERKTGYGHDDFTCLTNGVTIEEDLSRRDLTINAIAIRYNPMINDFDDVIDPHHGKQSIYDKVLIHINGDAFKEDPLRVFRVARFHAELGFRISTLTSMLCLEMRHSLKYLSGERVFSETRKALHSDEPRLFFDFLRLVGCLDYWFPELSVLHQSPAGPEKYHPEGSSFEHTMQALSMAKSMGGDDITLYATLCHDLGKGITPSEQWPHHKNHESMGVPLVEALSNRLRVPNIYKQCAVLACKEHQNIHRFNEMRAVKRVDLLSRIGGHVNRVTLAAKADARGRGPSFWLSDYPQRRLVLSSMDVYRSVRGEDVLSSNELAGNAPGEIISHKMRIARANALKKKFGLKK